VVWQRLLSAPVVVALVEPEAPEVGVAPPFEPLLLPLPPLPAEPPAEAPADAPAEAPADGTDAPLAEAPGAAVAPVLPLQALSAKPPSRAATAIVAVR